MPKASTTKKILSKPISAESKPPTPSPSPRPKKKAEKAAEKAPTKKGKSPSSASEPEPHKKNGHSPATVAAPAATTGSALDHPELQEKLRELIKLAKEQGYLTYDDLNEALPDGMSDPDE